MGLSRFVDAHVHFWQLSRLRYPWLTPPFSDDGPNGSVAAIAHDYLPDDYLKDAHGLPVAKVVHVQAGAHDDDALAETRWLQALADQGGFPHAIVAFAALNAPDLEATLEAHLESPNVRGIRHIANWHPDAKRTYTPRNLLDDPAWKMGYGLLAKHHLSFDLQIYPNQLIQAAEIAARHDDTPVILNHMGMPVDEDKAEWREGLRRLAQLPQASVKISGMGFVDRQWTDAAMRPRVLEVIDIFGASRVMFASDFPTDRLWNGFGRQIHFYDDLTRDFSAAERDALFGQNAERIYRI